MLLVVFLTSCSLCFSFSCPVSTCWTIWKLPHRITKNRSIWWSKAVIPVICDPLPWATKSPESAVLWSPQSRSAPSPPPRSRVPWQPCNASLLDHPDGSMHSTHPSLQASLCFPAGDEGHCTPSTPQLPQLILGVSGPEHFGLISKLKLKVIIRMTAPKNIKEWNVKIYLD